MQIHTGSLLFLLNTFSKVLQERSLCEEEINKCFIKDCDVALQNCVSNCRFRSINHNFGVNFMKIWELIFKRANTLYQKKTTFPPYCLRVLHLLFYFTFYFLNILYILGMLEKYICKCSIRVSGPSKSGSSLIPWTL